MTQDTETNPTDTDAAPSASIKTYAAIPAAGRDRDGILYRLS